MSNKTFNETALEMVKIYYSCHPNKLPEDTEKAFQEYNSFGRSGFPFKSKEYTDPKSVDYSNVEIPNALWHQSHTFTCFAYPTFGKEDCEQIGKALVKVIRAYSK